MSICLFFIAHRKLKKNSPRTSHKQSLRVVRIYDTRWTTSVRRNKMAEWDELYRSSDVCLSVSAASLFMIILHRDLSLHSIRNHNVIIQVTLDANSKSIPQKFSRKNELGIWLPFIVTGLKTSRALLHSLCVLIRSYSRFEIKTRSWRSCCYCLLLIQPSGLSSIKVKHPAVESTKLYFSLLYKSSSCFY